MGTNTKSPWTHFLPVSSQSSIQKCRLPDFTPQDMDNATWIAHSSKLASWSLQPTNCRKNQAVSQLETKIVVRRKPARICEMLRDCRCAIRKTSLRDQGKRRKQSGSTNACRATPSSRLRQARDSLLLNFVPGSTAQIPRPLSHQRSSNGTCSRSAERTVPSKLK